MAHKARSSPVHYWLEHGLCHGTVRHQLHQGSSDVIEDCQSCTRHCSSSSSFQDKGCSCGRRWGGPEWAAQAARGGAPWTREQHNRLQRTEIQPRE